jgi:hypothetical protein
MADVTNRLRFNPIDTRYDEHDCGRENIYVFVRKSIMNYVHNTWQQK